MKKELLKSINAVEQIASASKFQRMLTQPFNYIHAILFRELFYKSNKQEKEVICKTFFNTQMNILLPSSTDIYLTGGKSHFSEIRLARFLIRNLDKGDAFLDIGGHYGYFSLLAAQLVGPTGRVIAFEASPTTFRILEKNGARSANIKVYNKAVSDTKAELTFYEFPNLYSEYNTLDVSQFKNETWFKRYPPKAITIESVRLDEVLVQEIFFPKVIKIDVEGAEFKVLNGTKNYLEDHSPIIVMEYLAPHRSNEVHLEAELFLTKLGFRAYLINPEGNLVRVVEISKYLDDNGLESDNIVFIKQ